MPSGSGERPLRSLSLTAQIKQNFQVMHTFTFHCTDYIR
uniref:Uncharacterized protein n=1 Tax=Anguilla anguilla TaxID=7936 RepID=A0A0E9QA68_ANGAN